MNARFLGAAVMATMVGCVGATTAFADSVVLPDPSFGGLLIGMGVPQPVTGPGSHTLSITGALTSGSATVIGLTEPFPWVSASAQAHSLPGGGPVTFFSSGELHYDIEITGPTSDVWVDVSGRTIIGPSGNAELRVSGDELLNGTEPSLSFDFQLLLATGSVIPVQLNAAALAFVEESGSSSSSAYIDPYFTIDPSNTNADEYSILVSPGVGNSPSGAPEPSTWAMLLLGFAGLSFAGYRKRKTKNELTAFAA